jgi:hypothetical protein
MSTFHTELQALRDKYPTHYIEGWTPDDFVSVLEEGSLPPSSKSWYGFTERVSQLLYDGFDANTGTHWERIQQATEQVYKESQQ